MKLAVIGSRKVQDRTFIESVLDSLRPGITALVSGGAIGVDSIAEEWALSNSVERIVFLPDYDSFGIAAPLKRNLQIIKECDSLIAFWDGSSRGTAYTAKNAKAAKKLMTIYLLNEDGWNELNAGR